jgi:hypothetical protein
MPSLVISEQARESVRESAKRREMVVVKNPHKVV